MAPPNRARHYYCELSDRTLLPSATSKSTRSKPSIEACWRHLRRWRDANFKCSERTWRSAIVNKRCRSNEPSWRLCESRWNPTVGVFLFFSQFCFIGFFSFIIIFFSFFSFFFLSSASWFGSWSKITSTCFFPPRVGTRAWNRPYIGGFWKTLRSWHFRQKGIDIPDAVKDVIGLGYETMQELWMKERNATLDGFQELLTDCVLIYERAVVAILLHEFVSSD